jgi:ABC-type sugar transport system permease subunit
MVFLAELRGGYWAVLILVSIFYLLRDRNQKRIKLKYLAPIPVLLLILSINQIIYGVFTPAREAEITAYYSNNKYSYLLDTSFQIDHFIVNSKEENKNFCLDSRRCTEEMLAEVSMYPINTGFSFLQKVDSYFFEAQKIPRLPGFFELKDKQKVIEIGPQSLTFLNLVASIFYFVYRSTFLVILASLVVNILTRTRKEKLILFRKFEDTVLCIPWFGLAVPSILFFTETRVWIVSELMMFPLLMRYLSNVQRNRNTDSEISNEM